MLRIASKKNFFSPDFDVKPAIYLNHRGGTRAARNKKKRLRRLLWRLGVQVARALRCMSMRRRSSSRKVSSASLGRSRSLADAIDSQRAEAVEDCIEFLKSSSSSSSSLQRSNLVSANSI